ncbi:hypothetical protein SAMN02745216_02035 [Desulfatibacillum alkenivorans DSM 16219]|uniref:DUF1643 domain-containing protein n=1 Tax=Desulfatibacillum alkenivorans DSM 16219 TaxID=1121393 RepID=A0A1M6L5N1_9BACT|nr:DUF1643 domain-containing protein [Desulfatibacillum alkenivorans]SHJ66404.1 hypothetical protein SAMN02745216_02035 [Desulfatibacillum alkenivorans DSM 16219]
MIKKALISPSGRYRWSLERIWDESGPIINFVGLNPSTADDKNDDQTIKLCIRFAKGWGYGGLIMTNLFAWRSRNPRAMEQAEYPVGEFNDEHILGAAHRSAGVVACWGARGNFQGRDKKVLALLVKRKNVMCLGLTKYGQPRHLIGLRKDTELCVFEKCRGDV